MVFYFLTYQIKSVVIAFLIGTRSHVDMICMERLIICVIYLHKGFISQFNGNSMALESILGNSINNQRSLVVISLSGEIPSRKYLMIQICNKYAVGLIVSLSMQ